MFQNLITGRLEGKRVGRYAIIRNKTAFTLAEGATHVALWNKQRKIAFTLAEVLITLGIIGIVAALTMPALIDNHNKKVVEARLEKFYSGMNQAIRMAELDYGPREYWFEDTTDMSLREEWIKKYLIPYMKVIDMGRTNVEEYKIYLTFEDGSSLASASTNGRDWLFFPGNINKCLELGGGNYREYVGKCAFSFFYNPVLKSDVNGKQWNFEPYMAGWDGKESSLKNHSTYGCNVNSTWPAYCTRWIQYNGWKIPKDYPFRVKYK